MVSIFKTKKAFTLIELLVVIFIMLVLIVGSVQIFIVGNRNINIMWEQLATQNQANFAVNRFIDYTRTAEVSSIGAYPLEVTNPYELTFYANVDSDSLIEKVKFWLDSNNNFEQSITKPNMSSGQLSYDTTDGATETVLQLAHSISNFAISKPIFLYYDKYYNGSGDALVNFNTTDVRMIKLQLQLERDVTKSPVPLNVESTVLVRSLHNN
ncbi:MAG: prepilin-type N-terminal cleavage/methylation domain-containing protein [Candidatus Magasanikbacteria bacterium]